MSRPKATLGDGSSGYYAACLHRARPSGRRRGRLIRTLDQFEIVRDFETRVREGVGVVPLDPYVWSLPSALRRNTDDRPASLEQAMTPDHEVADAELSHTRLRLRGVSPLRNEESARPLFLV